MERSHFFCWLSSWITVMVALTFLTKTSAVSIKVDCQNETCNITNYKPLDSNEKIEIIGPNFEDLQLATKIRFKSSNFRSFPTNQSVKLPHVRYIVAISCGMLASEKPLIDPASIFEGNNIEKLDMNGNNFRRLQPTFFENLKRLMTLILYSCRIEIIDGNAFHDLESLVELNLDNNRLVILDLGIFKKNNFLAHLFLRKNKMTNLTLTENNFNLKIVVVSSNEIKDVTFLAFLRNLEILSIAFNPELQLDDGSFSANDALLNLWMAGINLHGKFTYEALFGKLINLKTLDIGDNKLGYLDIEDFPRLTALIQLGVYGNELTGIARYDDLKKKFPSLNEIDVSENNWDCTYLRFMLWNFGRKGVKVSFLNPYVIWKRNGRANEHLSSVEDVECHVGSLTIWICILSLGIVSAILLAFIVVKCRKSRRRTSIPDVLNVQYDHVSVDASGYVIMHPKRPQ